MNKLLFFASECENIDLIQSNWTRLENMYKELIDLDFKIKSGKAEEESFGWRQKAN